MTERQGHLSLVDDHQREELLGGQRQAVVTAVEGAESWDNTMQSRERENIAS
jgi:hypothetical protein